MLLLSLPVSLFAQITWKFDVKETKAFADFFKQESAEPGKLNAEVVGIDIHAPGFSWDDMNTWKDANGKVFKDGATSSFANTIWGGSFSTSAPYNGRMSTLTWTDVATDNKWNDSPVGSVKLAGTFSIETIANVLHCSGTKISKAAVAMQCPNDCYLHIKRNQNLKQIDLSNSTGKLREFYGFENSLQGKDAIIMNNVRATEFLDWGSSIVKNNLLFSTMPLKPNGQKFAGYDKQKSVAVGEYNGSDYEIMVGEDIDLSEEFDVHNGNLTVFTWKNEEGDVITPSDSWQGYFNFDESFIGQTLVCEMTNPFFPALLLKTVPCTVVDEYTLSDEKNQSISIRCYPNPASEILYVEAEGMYQLSLISISGKVVYEQSGNSRTTLNISKLEKGVYLLKVTLDKGYNFSKIIKR